MAYRVGRINDHLYDDWRSNEPGGANGVTTIAAAKACNWKRALPAKRSFTVSAMIADCDPTETRILFGMESNRVKKSVP